MAWTAPATFTDGAVLTAAQLNAIRDNLNETVPAKATAQGGYFVATGLNAIAQRFPAAAYTAGGGTTTSTSLGDLVSPAAVGPSVAVTSGALVLIAMVARASTNIADRAAIFSYDVSGATTIAAGASSTGCMVDGMAAGAAMRVGVTELQGGLSSGVNTFTMKYATNVGGTTASFSERRLLALPY